MSALFRIVRIDRAIVNELYDRAGLWGEDSLPAWLPRAGTVEKGVHRR